MTDFDEIYKKYHKRLLLYSLKFIDNEADALDLVQDVFIAVWESKMYLSEENHLQSYMFLAIRNKCYNYLKHNMIVKKYEKNASIALKKMELDFYQEGEKSLIEKENLKKIESAVNSLTNPLKEAIVLSRFEGMNNKQIAEKLGISIRTVETRIFRALVILRKKVSEGKLPLLLYINRLIFSKKKIQKKNIILMT